MEPSSVLAVWAAGLAAGAGLVAIRRVVGPGYTWLAFGSALGFGVAAALAGSGAWAWAGAGLAVGGIVAARFPLIATLLGALSAAALTVAASSQGVLAALTGAVLLGGITSEMMLGHWYLVDPRLPRSELRRLALIGGVGILLDVAATVALGAIPWAVADELMGWAFIVLAAVTAGLMVMVWFALGERGYSGVMAATGLSYLAVLTAVGVAVLGRALVAA